MKKTNLTKMFVIFILVFISLGSFVYGDFYRDYINTPVTPESLPSSGILFADPNTGAAVFSYPFEMPPGTNDLDPVLSLSYSSHNKNSYPELVGSGWSLTQSYVQRDANYYPHYTSKHKFILIFNGESHELVYDSSDGRYHTKIESFLSIKNVSGGDNQNKEYWEVKTKDGVIYRFGYNADSELVSNKHSYTWRWYLDLVTDTHGNKIYYSYKEDPYTNDIGTSYLDKIEYNNGKEREVTFDYESLPTFWKIFDNGQKVRRTHRLNQINIYANGQLIRKYSIGYTANDVGTRSYISSITEHGSDGSSLPPTTFSYTGIEKGWVRDSDLENKLPSYVEFSYDEVDAGTRLVDLNRDGMIDIIQNIKWKFIARNAYLNSYGGSFNRDDSYTPPENSKFIDRFDWVPMDVGVRLGDYNGDGYPDLIRGFYDEDRDEEYYDIWENTGNGWTHSSAEFFTKFSIVEDHPGYYEYVDTGVRLADLNGDGYVDVLKARSSESKNAWVNKKGWWKEESKWELPQDSYFIESDGDDEGVRLVDINGDGLMDMYQSDDGGNKELWLNKGIGWELDSDWPISKLPDNIDAGNDDEGVRIADVNGDGLADVIRAQSSSREAYINTGEDWAYDPSWNVPDEAEFVDYKGNNEGTRLADINGDGSPDIVRMKSEGGSLFKLAWSNKASKQFLLDEVKLSPGGKFKIGYMNSAETQSNEMGFNQWIVESISYIDMEDHHETNDYLDCIPSDCPAGYEDKGVDCSSETACTRICEVTGCGSWVNIKDSQTPWSDHDIDGSVSGMLLFEYSDFDQDKCYKVETWSDNNIISSSDIDHEDDDETDSAMALSWTTGWGSSAEQIWGDYCKPDHTGDLLNRKHHYLIDDNENGDDYDSADDLGGSWTGYCMPPSEGCEGYSKCTTECYDKSWAFELSLAPNMPNDYEDGSPGSSRGACRVDDVWESDAETDYIRFENDKYVGMRVWKADLVTTGSDNQVCQKTPAATAFYSYSGGLYDYEDKEFRGFNYVEETRPDGSKIKHWFHQDDSKKGKVYKTEILDGSDNPFQKTEYTWESETGDGYYITRLIEMTDYAYDGSSSENPKITKVTYGYDDYGNVIKTSYLGDTSKTGDERYEYFEYVYNTNDWIVDKPKHIYMLDYDDSTKVSESWFRYDERGYDQHPTRGDLTYIEYWLDTGSNPIELYSYDSYGNIVNYTDPRGYTTDYEYDPTHTFVTKEINAKGHETSFEYDLGTGNLISETDPNNIRTEYEYDVFGREVKEIRPYDSSPSPSIEIIYNFDGVSPEEVVVKTKDSETTTLDKYYYYDGFGNLAQEKEESETSQLITIDYYYDSINRMGKETNPYYSSQGYTSPNSSVEEVSYVYDPINRVIKFVNPDGTEVDVEYDHWNTTVFDENDNKKMYSQDAFSNTIMVKEYEQEEEYITEYFYDPLGNIVRIVDNQGNEIEYTYDSLGRKIELSDPDLGSWTYQYDSNDNIINQTYANGNSILMEYDELDRIIAKSFSGGMFTYEYDHDKIGMLSGVETPDMNVSYEHDDRLRLTLEEKEIDGVTFTTAFSYDPMDRVISTVLPDSSEMYYTYNEQGLDSITGYVSDIDYNQMQLPVKRLYENTLETEFTYYPADFRLKEIKTSNLQDLDYQYDNVGNTLEIVDSVSGKTEIFGYDELYRLKSAEKGNVYNISYSYDSIGNLLNMESDNMTYVFEYDSGPVHSPVRVVTYYNNETIPGDVDHDCEVDIFDLARVGKAYSSRPGNPYWNEYADLNGDWVINIFDLATVGVNYGRKC